MSSSHSDGFSHTFGPGLQASSARESAASGISKATDRHAGRPPLPSLEDIGYILARSLRDGI
jgi:hypothetical protein